MTIDRLTVDNSTEAPWSMHRHIPYRNVMILQAGLAAAEFVLLTCLLLLAALFSPLPLVPIGAAVIAAAVVTTLQWRRAYGLARLLEPLRIGQATYIGFAVLAAALLLWVVVLAPGDHMLFFGALLLAGGAALAGWALRLLVSVGIKWRISQGGLRRHVALVVAGDVDADLIERKLKAETNLPAAIRRFAFDASPCEPRVAVRRADSLHELINRAECDEVLLAVQGIQHVDRVAHQPQLEELLTALEMLPHRTRIALIDERRIVRFAHLLHAPLDNCGLVLKRAMDVVLSSAALLILAPGLLLVALAIRLDSRGPVFFKQLRFGYSNSTFEIWKFRSMYTEMSDANAEKLTKRNDPRVTRVGAFIRRSSIDELPQLFNVLKGDMSLVGPRPHPLSAKAGDRLYGEVVERFGRRYRVKPGLTGLAQVSGLRGNTDTEDKLERRFEKDLEYVRNWSLWRDIAILVRTPLASLSGENAY